MRVCNYKNDSFSAVDCVNDLMVTFLSLLLELEILIYFALERHLCESFIDKMINTLSHQIYTKQESSESRLFKCSSCAVKTVIRSVKALSLILQPAKTILQVMKTRAVSQQFVPDVVA